jgi:hypothetical protein
MRNSINSNNNLKVAWQQGYFVDFYKAFCGGEAYVMYTIKDAGSWNYLNEGYFTTGYAESREDEVEEDCA